MIQEEISRDNDINEGINDDIVEKTILEIHEIEGDEKNEEYDGGKQEKESNDDDDDNDDDEGDEKMKNMMEVNKRNKVR